MKFNFITLGLPNHDYESFKLLVITLLKVIITIITLACCMCCYYSRGENALAEVLCRF